MWHIMVYTNGFKSYCHPYAVHLFTSRKISPERAFKRVAKILAEEFSSKWKRRAFPPWIEGEEVVLEYAGYEKIPVKLPEGYIAVRFSIGRWSDEIEIERYIPRVPLSDFATLEEYRRRQITLDYDIYDEEEKWRVLRRVEEAVAFLESLSFKESVKVYKTLHGYHVRALLKQPLHSINEVLYLRKNLLDDPYRYALDMAYMHEGLVFLTNVLFNEKCWYNNGSIICKKEEEVEVVDGRVYTKELADLKRRLSTLIEKLTSEVRG